MLTIQIICIGKIKEPFLKDAIAEYQKRLSKYCHLTITELPDEKLPNKLNHSIMQSIKETETQRILSSLKKDSYVFALDLKGKAFSSEEFSQKIEQIALKESSSITFIIGGTLGLSSSIYSHCNELISFSKMTFPHQLIRLFLVEQLFRAFKIAKGEHYHW